MRLKEIIYLIIIFVILGWSTLSYVYSDDIGLCTEPDTKVEKTFFKVTCTGEFISESGEIGTSHYSTSTGLGLSLILLTIVVFLYFFANNMISFCKAKWESFSYKKMGEFFQKIKYPLIGGIIGLLISILFVTGLGDTLTFGLVDELFFVSILFILSYPITAPLCFFATGGRMCQGEEGMIILLTGPIAGFLIGMLIGYLIYKFKRK